MKPSPTLSPSVNELTISRFMTNTDDAVLEGLHDAVKLCRELALKAREVAVPVLDNDLKTLPQRHREARHATFALFETASKTMDAAAKAANDEMAAIKLRLRGPAAPKDQIKQQREAELRERLAMLPEQRRRDIIAGAIKSDDDQLISAILHARDWEVGLSVTDLDLFRHQWGERRYPDHFKRLQRIESAIDAAQVAGTQALAFVAELTDAEMVEAAETKDKKATAALAAAKV